MGGGRRSRTGSRGALGQRSLARSAKQPWNSRDSFVEGEHRIGRIKAGAEGSYQSNPGPRLTRSQSNQDEVDRLAAGNDTGEIVWSNDKIKSGYVTLLLDGASWTTTFSVRNNLRHHSWVSMELLARLAQGFGTAKLVPSTHRVPAPSQRAGQRLRYGIVRCHSQPVIQLGPIDRFNQVDVEARFQSLFAVFRPTVGGVGDEKDPGAQSGSHGSRYTLAVKSRQANIDDSHLGVSGQRLCHPFYAIRATST